MDSTPFLQADARVLGAAPDRAGSSNWGDEGDDSEPTFGLQTASPPALPYNFGGNPHDRFHDGDMYSDYTASYMPAVTDSEVHHGAPGFGSRLTSGLSRKQSHGRPAGAGMPASLEGSLNLPGEAQCAVSSFSKSSRQLMLSKSYWFLFLVSITLSVFCVVGEIIFRACTPAKHEPAESNPFACQKRYHYGQWWFMALDVFVYLLLVFHFVIHACAKFRSNNAHQNDNAARSSRTAASATVGLPERSQCCCCCSCGCLGPCARQKGTTLLIFAMIIYSAFAHSVQHWADEAHTLHNAGDIVVLSVLLLVMTLRILLLFRFYRARRALVEETKRFAVRFATDRAYIPQNRGEIYVVGGGGKTSADSSGADNNSVIVGDWGKEVTEGFNMYGTPSENSLLHNLNESGEFDNDSVQTSGRRTDRTTPGNDSSGFYGGINPGVMVSPDVPQRAGYYPPVPPPNHPTDECSMMPSDLERVNGIYINPSDTASDDNRPSMPVMIPPSSVVRAGSGISGSGGPSGSGSYYRSFQDMVSQHSPLVTQSGSNPLLNSEQSNRTYPKSSRATGHSRP